MDDTQNQEPQNPMNEGDANFSQTPTNGNTSGFFSGDDSSTTAQQTTNNEEFLQLKAELEQTQTKLQEMIGISQHALADLQNYKRRAEEDRINFAQYANTKFILDFLPALSNIERALQHDPKDQEWIKGVEQILKQFSQILEKQNVQTIATVGQKFDPKFHEALMTGPGEKDTVIAEFEKGYTMGERVIKQARVKVGNGESEEALSTETPTPEQTAP